MALRMATRIPGAGDAGSNDAPSKEASTVKDGDELRDALNDKLVTKAEFDSSNLARAEANYAAKKAASLEKFGFDLDTATNCLRGPE